MRNKHGYDLNSLLILGNIIICCIGIYLYSTAGGNEYIDLYTLLLLCVFGVQNILILLHERKKRNPLITVLMLVNLVYYMGRIVTLLYEPWSVTLGGDVFTANDLNYALLFILLANTAIFFGLIAPTKKGKSIINNCEETRYSSPLIVIIILLMMIIISLFGLLKFEFIGRIAGFITVFLVNIQIVLLLTILYIIINYKKISKIYLTILITLIIFYVLSHTLMGSRQAIILVIILWLFVKLSIESRVAITKKMIVLSVAIVPTALFVFTLATFIRSSIPSTDAGSIGKERINILIDYEGPKGSIEKYLLPIFDRIGFLDYSTDVIRNSNKYSDIINFPYYIESIVDNTLTPGFDIFNTIRVSWAAPYVSKGFSIPTREDVIDAYQSNQITVYGEHYVLFGGYASLIILFCVSYLFQNIYLRVNRRNTFPYLFYRSLVILIFYYWLNSYGIDWLFMDLITMLISICLLKNFYYVRKMKYDKSEQDCAPELKDATH